MTRNSPRRPSLRARFAAQRQHTENMKSGSAKAIQKAGLTGTPNTSWRNEAASRCRLDCEQSPVAIANPILLA